MARGGWGVRSDVWRRVLVRLKSGAVRCGTAGCTERPCTAGALLHAALNGLGAGHAGWRAGPPGWAALNLTPESNPARAPRSPGWVTWIICSKKRTSLHYNPNPEFRFNM